MIIYVVIHGRIRQSIQDNLPIELSFGRRVSVGEEVQKLKTRPMDTRTPTKI